MLHALLFIHNPDIFSSGRSVSLLVYLELGLQSELTGEGKCHGPCWIRICSEDGEFRSHFIAAD